MVTIVVQIAGGVCTGVSCRPAQESGVTVVDWDDILDDIETLPDLPEGVVFSRDYGHLVWDVSSTWTHLR